ncbi:hypothetical protein EDD18DRAFT_650555 [Armillaria luteobubalina]|uniref:Uncharacterized protein n=1 Tax=Armillaria luteobubalina TaxID=153913 RepID=A0AA39PPP5_9AGAR|nr:hypothetical protein EDD18DRAFT_650555 [Armillaria luteobubalina]
MRTSSIAIVICLIYSISHLRIVESGLNRISQWVRKVFEPSRILLARLFPRNKFELIYIFLDTINVSSGIFHPFKQVSSSLSVLAIMMYIIARGDFNCPCILTITFITTTGSPYCKLDTLIPHII